MQLPEFGKQKPDMIGQFGHGAHGGSRIFDRIALIDGNSRWNPFYAFHLGFVHAVQKLSGISRKTFDVAALPLGIKGVKSKARLARAAHPGDDNKLVDGDVEM